MTFTTAVSAEETADVQETYVTYGSMLNGERYSEQALLKRGSTNTLSIQDVSYGGEMIEAANITYQWYSDVNGNTEIEGATASSYSFEYKGEEGYCCLVTVSLADGAGCLYGTRANKQLNLMVNALSTSGSPITYKWICVKKTGPVDMGTSNTLSVTKADKEQSLYGGERGAEEYECWIEDGTARKMIRFCLYLVATENSVIDTPKGSLSAAISNSNEVIGNLNAFLDNSDEVKDALAEGKIVSQIKLDTKAKKEVELAEEIAINNVLPKSSVVGMYLDVNLYAEMQEGLEGNVTMDVPLTETGSPVSIMVEVPEDILNTDSTVNRTYEVIRVHDDKAEALGCEFKDKKVTFSTDKFSTYALAYADTKKSEGGSQGSGTDGSNEGQGSGQGTGTGAGSSQDQQMGTASQPEFKAVTAAAATGDMPPAGGHAITMFLASVVLVGMFIKKRNVR